MFKSIFAKYLTAFMTIIIVSFAVLAAITGAMISSYSTDERLEMVSTASNAVQKYIQDDFNKEPVDDLRSYSFFNYSEKRNALSVFTSYEKNLMIFITDTDGNVLITDKAVDSEYVKMKLPESIISDIKENGEIEGISDLDGLLTQKYVYHGIRILNSKGGTAGFTFALAKNNGMTEIAVMLTRTIFTAMLWIMIAALLTVYFITAKNISPLTKLSHAAKEYAKGNFTPRVEVKGSDEVAVFAQTFNNMAQSLQDLELSRSTFLSNVSHDLRTPMTSISGFLDGMIDGVIPKEKYSDYFVLMSAEVKRLSRLVGCLLDVSRLESGARKYVPEKFDICEMARQIVISFEKEIDSKKLEIEFNVDDFNMFAYADKDATHQVLYNICHNAIKFSKEKGKFKVSIKRKDKKLFVSVYNEGIGISSDDLPHLFDRFYKSDKSRGLDKTGAGLGLYICKTIMEQQNQQIWVESVYGEYCEFIFTLDKYQ